MKLTHLELLEGKYAVQTAELNDLKEKYKNVPGSSDRLAVSEGAKPSWAAGEGFSGVLGLSRADAHLLTHIVPSLDW